MHILGLSKHFTPGQAQIEQKYFGSAKITTANSKRAGVLAAATLNVTFTSWFFYQATLWPPTPRYTALIRMQCMTEARRQLSQAWSVPRASHFAAPGPGEGTSPSRGAKLCQQNTHTSSIRSSVPPTGGSSAAGSVCSRLILVDGRFRGLSDENANHVLVFAL